MESDNQINYYAGPIKINISGWTEEIEISSSKRWEHLLKEAVEIAKEAWEIEENQIEKEEESEKITIKIKYNYNNLKLYIEHNIIFM
jgi:coenzyme F420-reducing hydrogenase alpha subunit